MNGGRHDRALYVLLHPLAFVWRVLKSFMANQGLLLAGAVAYYALLSIVPLLILSVFALSHLVSQAELFAVLGRYLEWLVPSQSQAVLADVDAFLRNGLGIGFLLVGSLLFFSSLRTLPGWKRRWASSSPIAAGRNPGISWYRPSCLTASCSCLASPCWW